MNILVTGSSGYIGKNLTRKLLTAGYNTFEFDIQDGDIAKIKPLQYFQNANIDHVFHLAGRTYVPDSWKDPFPFYENNFLGTVNALEFCRTTGASMTHLSSYVYGTPQFLPITEDHPLEAYNPYSQSKIFADQVCQFYQKQFQVNVTILRLFNIYGPGQSSRFLIPELIHKALDPGVDEVEVNDLRPRRDFVFINDVLEALIKTINRKSPGIFNIGSGSSNSAKEIVDSIFKIIGISKIVTEKNIERPNEIFDLYADISLARIDLGWKPEISLSEGLRKCISYEKEMLLILKSPSHK